MGLLERKYLVAGNVKRLATDATKHGQVEGYAGTFGNIDSYGDTVVRGAYAETIPAFLKTGFLAFGHDWTLQIGMPDSMTEDDTGLFARFDYHSTPEAQTARTITNERLDRDKAMGLSIGYEALEWEMRKVETPFRTWWGGVSDEVRVLKKIKLIEVSLTPAPADQYAQVTAGKMAGLERWDQSMPLHAHASYARDGVVSLVERAKSLASLREAKGQKAGAELSRANRAILTDLLDALDALGPVKDQITDLLSRTDPASSDDDSKAESGATLYAAYLRSLALLHGAPA